MSRKANMCRAAAVAAVVFAAVPVASHAQIVIGGGSGGGMVLSTGGSATAKKEAPVKMVSADSLAKLRTYAKTKEPVIVIDGAVTTLKALQALPDAKIASIVFQEGENEVRHYGKKAENGVLIVKTGTPAKADATKKDASSTKIGDLEMKTEGGIKIEMRQ